MFDEIRRWLVAHPRWALAFLVGAALVPFLAKPFNIDDPLFIWLAQQIHAHPGDPFGYKVNWYGESWPMWGVTENPPLAGYYYALAGSLFGWSEVAMHLAGLLAALAVVLGTHRLALNLCKQPVLAASAAFLTPVFLVSANTVMCDMLMLAFWIWAVVYWLEGLEQDRVSKIIFAGVLMALALLTKYFGACLLPLLAVHGAMQKRRAGPWVIGLLIPLAVLGAYQWLTLALYHHALFSAAAGFATSVQSELGFSRLAAGLIALAFMGGGAASVLFLAPILWRPRTFAMIAVGAAILAGVIGGSGHFLDKYTALGTPKIQIGVLAQFVPWVVGGVFILALAIGDIWKNPRDARSWLLGLWVAGTFCFAGFANWTVNGRSILPLLPAAGILLARRWDACGQKHPRWLFFGLAASGLLGVLVAQSDFRLAIAVRDSAEEAFARCNTGSGTVWFEGHWGFQYYMQKFGAKAVDFKHSMQLPGDFLVLPQHNTDASSPAPQIIGRQDVFSITNSPVITTWHANAGAGFYSSVVGPLPFAFGNVPPETVYIIQLKAPDAK